MSRIYEIGHNRTIEFFDNGHVTIKDSEKALGEALFNRHRWSRFLKIMKKVDKYVKKLDTDSSFEFQKQLGDMWNVSVTNGYRCVQIREYYYNRDHIACPSRHGIALRLPEWRSLTNITNQMTSELTSKSAERKPNKKHSSKTDY